MKKRDLIQRIKAAGWWEVGGTKHEKWTNGIMTELVPRHTEIAEYLAKKILKKIESNPVKK